MGCEMSIKKLVVFMAGALAAFVIVMMLAVNGAFFLSKRIFDNYYESTIYNVQTIDFNVASSTFPAVLSGMLLGSDFDGIQKVADSSYGKFGIIVTDCKLEGKSCPSQKIISRTMIESVSEQGGWLLEAVSSLSDHHYDVLRDPPPLKKESEFKLKEGGAYEFRSLGRINEGQVIGRVYYIRKPSPEFQEYYEDWWRSVTNNFSGLFGGSLASNTTYAHVYFIVFGFLLWCAGVYFLWKYLCSLEQQKKLELEILERQRLINELDGVNRAIQSEIEEFRVERSSLRKQLDANELQWGLVANELKEELAKLNELKAKKTAQAELSAGDSRAVVRLQKKIEELSREKDQIYVVNSELSGRLESINLDLSSKERQASQFQTRLDHLSQQIGILEHQLSRSKRSEVEAQSIVEGLQNENDELWSFNFSLGNENEKLKHEIASLLGLPQVDISSTVEALELAWDKNSDVLDLWQSAIESAGKFNRNPKRVYDVLGKIAEVGREYFKGNMSEGLVEFFAKHGVDVSYESKTTMGKYGKERLFSKGKGTSRVMELHAKVGDVRIYFHLNKEDEKVEIGYCGRHLNTAKFLQ